MPEVDGLDQAGEAVTADLLVAGNAVFQDEDVPCPSSPCRAAVAEPAGPAPTTMTSAVSVADATDPLSVMARVTPASKRL